MFPFNLLSRANTLRKKQQASRLPRHYNHRRSTGVKLGLEALEERYLLSSTITVTTPLDDPTGSISGQTTLRDAINQANANPGSTIDFAPSVSQYYVQPTAPLPAITGAGTTINGGLGSTFNNPETYLDGSKVSDSDGLDVEASDVTIEGLQITNFSGAGIFIDSGNGSTVKNNDIGTENGNRGANSAGITVTNATSTAITQNQIEDNTGVGIAIATATATLIQGNDISGNGGEGIRVVQGNTPSDTVIGGTASGQGNAIYNNGYGMNNQGDNSGIDIYGSGGDTALSQTALVTGNSIYNNNGNGITDGYLDSAGQNSGINVLFGITISTNAIRSNHGNGVETTSVDDLIQGNTISSNEENGVDIQENRLGSFAKIQGNSIYNNNELGIFGSEDAAAPPTLTSAIYTVLSGNPTLKIQGSFNNLYADGSTIEFFANNPSENPQGQTSLGTITIDSSGAFTATLTPGAGTLANTTQITATAWNGFDTSEFSNAVLATDLPVLYTRAVAPSTVTAGSTLEVSVGVSSSYTGNGVNEGSVTFSLVNPKNGAKVFSDAGVAVTNGIATDSHFMVPGGTPVGNYNLVALFTDPGGSFGSTSYTSNIAVTVKPTPAQSSPTLSAPPSLNVPPLLAFFDSLLAEVETVNANGTETITDSLFGSPLLVATFDHSGNLESVTLLGINVTPLFA